MHIVITIQLNIIFLYTLYLVKECGILTEGGLSLEGPAFRKMTPAQLDAIMPSLQVGVYVCVCVCVCVCSSVCVAGHTWMCV